MEWCCYCLHTLQDKDHEPCKKALWETMSEEYSQTRKSIKFEFDFEPKGVTIEVRKPPTRSLSY